MKKWFWILAGMLLWGAGCNKGTVMETPETVQETSVVQANDNAAIVDSIVENGGSEKMADQEKVLTDELGFRVDSFTTQSGKTVSFHAIKHGSLRIQYDNLEFEVDPVTKQEGLTVKYSDFPKADYILVTHEHFDHLDAEAIGYLEKTGTVIVTNAACAKALGRGEVMANGDIKTLRDDIRVEAVAAYNSTPGRDKFHPKGRDNGFILTLDGFRIYIAGDTEDIPEMASVKDIDVAFLPCNQPYTMTPQQFAHAAEMIQPRVLFPYHYSATPMKNVEAVMKDSNVDLRIRDYQ